LQRSSSIIEGGNMSVEKVAIITAGGSGMGAAAARRLAADGFKVGILSSSGKGEALAAELGGIGVTGSNQSVADLQRLVDAVVEKWGRIDVVNESWSTAPATARAPRSWKSATKTGTRAWTPTCSMSSARRGW